MAELEQKPLNWSSAPGVGYTVARRPDGGMNFTFRDLSLRTLKHWREFALEHLLGSDRLTRNLYDLRQLEELPERAIRYAVEANSDPAARYIRLAVVVSNRATEAAVRRIALQTIPGGAEIGIFFDIDKAEAWLNRPIDIL